MADAEEYTKSNGYVITNTREDVRETETPTKLTVRKVGEGGEALAGAEFSLFPQGSETASVVATTNEEGIVEFSFVEAGTWTIRETKAPEGYVLSDKAIEVVV